MIRIKYFCLFIYALTFFNVSDAQLNQFVPVDDLPTNRMLKKQKTGFIYNVALDTFAWGYAVEGNYKVMQIIDFKPFEIMSMDTYASWADNTIFLSSRVPWKAAIFNYRFEFKGKKLLYLDYSFEDMSEQSKLFAEAALKKGDIKEAVSQYNSLQYPTFYLNEAEVSAALISTANDLALKAAAENKFTEAVSYYEEAFAYYHISNLDPLVFNFQYPYDSFLASTGMDNWDDSLGVWLTNYGYYLYKAGLIDKSIMVNSFLASVYTYEPDAYLTLGDANFDCGKVRGAIAAYSQYVGVMRDLGKEIEIPQRVKDRLGSDY